MTSTLRLFRLLLSGHVGALVAALALGLGPLAAHGALATFDSPEAAMNAFGKAVADNDDSTMQALLGADYRDLIPPVGEPIRARFLAAWTESHGVQPAGDGQARIAVGSDGWTLPIPLVRAQKGWQFDTRAGAAEMRIRRIGRNERAAMQTLLAILDAQLEYVTKDHAGGGLLAYARKLASSPGKQDGLYWPTAEGEPPSPVGPALAAAAEGTKASPDGYHGYRYKLLTSQGPHAPGGKLDYVVRGKLYGGFAVIAWPARYRDTGVMTFMVNHDGQIFEQDLGPETSTKAAATTSFDPGPGWKKASP